MQTPLVTETYNDPLEELQPLKKKQKRDKEPRNRRERKPQQMNGSVAVRGESNDDGVTAVQNDTERSSSPVSELESPVRPDIPAQRLSSFDLLRSRVLGEIDIEWTVRLHPNDVSIWPILLYISRSEFYLESSTTRSIRYMGTIRCH